eukprot:TRINITY_DN10903_c0_g1_i4.p1 TRINITY_DN10903_c0_g1~~TRINITY_DN10903_c0_g1_i4.p1  ORF type:complete len:320 (+),score=34.23 TRINITY_DN10903_c0_g1_i4:32-991(+)
MIRTMLLKDVRPLANCYVTNLLAQCVKRGFSVTAKNNNAVSLAYDEFKAKSSESAGSPLVVCHGMLGSRHNWTSVAKQINKLTGRRVITVDARNHGDSPHTDFMSYSTMAADVVKLIKDMNIGPVSLMGHSMGGRTIMMLSALYSKEISIDRMIVVDISPLNQDFDVTSSNEWNMEHYFHCLKSVTFDHSKSLFQARKQADQQLAVRISDPMLRAWLLMNLRQNPENNQIEWRINLDGIHQAFKTEIARMKIPDDKIPAYSGPCLFVGGSESDYIPVADHEEIKEIFPSAQFKYVEGAGHWVHSQKPAQFLDTIIPFLK